MDNFLGRLGNFAGGIADIAQSSRRYTDSLYNPAAHAELRLREQTREDALQQRQAQRDAQLQQRQALGNLFQNVQGIDPQAAQEFAQAGGNPQMLGQIAQLSQAPQPELAEVYDPEAGAMRYVPKHQALGQISKAPDRKMELETEKGLRKEFTGINKEFVKVRDAYDRVTAAKDTPAGDVALIFNYMKMLDPGSVVREGEFATAQNAAGIPDRVRAAYNRAMDGTRLIPEQRADFTGQASELYNAQIQRYDESAETFRTLAERAGVNPEDVVIDFKGSSSAAPSAPQAATLSLEEFLAE